MAQRAETLNYYAEFLAEREEIQRLKWIISEKEGRDVGLERTLTEWVSLHRDDWRKARSSTARV